MTNDKPTTYTAQEEEALIFDAIMGLRFELEQVKAEASTLAIRKKHLERQKEEAEQAMIDYMQANGVKQTTVDKHKITLGSSIALEVTDIDAVPKEYIRIKREPNKIEINNALKEGQLAPTSNWFIVNRNPKITITHAKG